MFVCICHGVTDTDIENAVNQGAHSLAQVSARLDVATNCGGCAQQANKIINNQLALLANQLAYEAA